ncbi:very short patch repair endonuclease [Rhizobium ruizarguesonis]
MADIVTPEKRSLMMAGIRGKDTNPEILIRRALFARGWRYRVHDKRLPGKPDLVFPRLKAVVFVDGCFWHGHHCHLFRLPSSKVEFWRNKIGSNCARDIEVRRKLDELGWRHLTVWECAIKGRSRWAISAVIDMVAAWLESGEGAAEIEGKTDCSR